MKTFFGLAIDRILGFSIDFCCRHYALQHFCECVISIVSWLRHWYSFLICMFAVHSTCALWLYSNIVKNCTAFLFISDYMYFSYLRVNMVIAVNVVVYQIPVLYIMFVVISTLLRYLYHLGWRQQDILSFDLRPVHTTRTFGPYGKKHCILTLTVFHIQCLLCPTHIQFWLSYDYRFLTYELLNWS